MTTQDIIDRIDELVDDQLADGENVSDYMTGDHEYPRCPHCGRHWHGLRVTERIASMYSLSHFDPDYTVAADDSPVLCEGSEFIGPQRAPSWPEPFWHSSCRAITADISIQLMFGESYFQQLDNAIRETDARMAAFFESIRWPEPAIILWPGTFTIFDEVELAGNQPVCEPPPDIDIQFGPDNWVHEIRRIPPSLQFPRSYPGYRLVSPLQADVQRHWQAFTAPAYPLPESPGYDFSRYLDEDSPHYTVLRSMRHERRGR